MRAGNKLLYSILFYCQWAIAKYCAFKCRRRVVDVLTYREGIFIYNDLICFNFTYMGKDWRNMYGSPGCIFWNQSWPLKTQRNHNYNAIECETNFWKVYCSMYIYILIKNGISIFFWILAEMYLTGRVGVSQPAKKNGRCVKEEKNSNADVMYIHVFTYVV
jgi:hypothetical protein